MIKILIAILIIIVLVGFKYYWESTWETTSVNNTENFKLNIKSTTNTIGNLNKNLNKVKQNVKNIRNLQNMRNAQNDLKQGQINQIDQQVLFNNKDYNENLSIDNKDNKYYYTDMINQSNINETAFNVVYSIDPINYSDVKTGIDKCNEQCGGVCFENGYDGIATCYPKENQPFDWGTLYKNPTFTYGYNFV